MSDDTEISSTGENSNEMKEDSNEMKEDSNEMKEDSNEMKEDSNEIKEDSNEMKEELKTNEIKEELEIEEPKKPSLSQRYTEVLSRFFYHLGYFIGRWNTPLLIMSVLVAGLLGIGLMKAITISDPGLLWVDPKSIFSIQADYFNQYFGGFYATIIVILTTNNQENILTAKYIRVLDEINSQLLSLQVPYNGGDLNYTQLCAHAWIGSPCIIQSPLYYWNTWNESDASLIAAVNSPSAQSPVKELLVPNQLLGGIQQDPVTGKVTAAQGLMATYLMWGSSDYQERVYAFEAGAISLLQSIQQNTTDLNIAYYADRSIQDVLNSIISQDFKYVIISYVIMLVYVCIALGKLDFVESRILVGICAVCSIILSIILSLGLCCAAGISFSPISLEVVPFLLLGVGVNDIFVVTDAFSRLKDVEDTTERMALTYKKVGTSAILTAATNSIAFFVAAATTMPAVRWFCIEAGVGILSNWFMLLCFYSPILIFDARRVQQNRLDVLFCIKLKQKDVKSKNSKLKQIVKTFITQYYAPFLSVPIVNLIIILLFIGFIGAGIYGALQIQRGLGVQDVVPSNSYPAIYFQTLADYFPDVGPPVYIVFENINYTDWTVQDQMTETINNVEANIWISGSVISWWQDFATWTTSFGNLPQYNLNTSTYLINGRIPPNKFYDWLYFFVNQDLIIGNKYYYDVIFNSDKTVIASRMLTLSQGLDNNSAYVDATTSVVNSVSEAGLNAFPYSVFYVFFAQYLVIVQQSLILILGSLATTLFVTLLLTAHIGVTLVTGFNICFILLDVLAIMSGWGIQLNAISVANLVICVGLSVEFSAYIARSYVNSKSKTSEEKMRDALIEMGAAVFNGGMTAFLGVVVLSGANYHLFAVYYFRMWFTIVVVGLSFGLIFLPAVLAHSFVKLFSPICRKKS